MSGIKIKNDLLIKANPEIVTKEELEQMLINNKLSNEKKANEDSR